MDRLLKHVLDGNITDFKTEFSEKLNEKFVEKKTDLAKKVAVDIVKIKEN